ncbi:MAG: hypothetical protein IKO75_08760 [Bacteroidales bacterium]|nr:hypothetical protein [Bacteroidales bacterium]
MDFDSILYIILILGSILLSVVKSFKKDEAERQVKKSRSGRPIIVEEADVQEEVQPQRRARVAPQPGQNNEYFSYETMSERDFEQAFAQNMEEEANTPAQTSTDSKIKLTIDEEEVYKGVVWSEILKRKY